jgi:hypothetical protein
VAQSYAEAVWLLGLAAAQGLCEAQCALGAFYYQGDGVARNPAEAARLFGLAAAQGHPLAQYNLGTLYAEGTGVSQDSAEAARRWRLAAAQGHTEAQCELGRLYAEGTGVARDYAEAARFLWHMAAAQGSAPAAAFLKTLASERAYVSVCCMGCGVRRKLKTCVECKSAKFCGPECVRRLWPEHKPHCKRWTAALAPAAGDWLLIIF